MGSTSNETKQRYNTEHYTQVKVSIKPEIAAKFKAECAAKGVSMASEISRFMSGQKSSSHNEAKVSKALHKQDFATRQLRRKATTKLITQLEAIIDAEQQYKDNIPINLQNSSIYETAEQAVSALEEALSNLHEAF